MLPGLQGTIRINTPAVRQAVEAIRGELEQCVVCLQNSYNEVCEIEGRGWRSSGGRQIRRTFEQIFQQRTQRAMQACADNLNFALDACARYEALEESEKARFVQRGVTNQL